jgi:hypothetical protein
VTTKSYFAKLKENRYDQLEQSLTDNSQALESTSVVYISFNHNRLHYTNVEMATVLRIHLYFLNKITIQLGKKHSKIIQ